MRIWEVFSSLFTEGGWVLYPIFAVSVFTWFLATGKLRQYGALGRARRTFLQHLENRDFFAKTGNIRYDALLQRLSRKCSGVALESALTDFVTLITPRMGYGLSTISACIVISPLLGLLGTISGMNEMFSIIGAFGFGSPSIMASGISMALKATLTGLAVAVVALFFLDTLKTRRMALLAAIAKDNRLIMQRFGVFNSADNVKPEEHGMYSLYNSVSSQEEKPDINLAPFVDTIMILLIFFVVTANLYVETGITVTKPKAQSATPSSQKAMLIGITREGTCHVYGRQVTMDKLQLLVEQESEKQPDLSVVIIADRETQTGKTVEVMDKCSLGGARKISIAAGKD